MFCVRSCFFVVIFGFCVFPFACVQAYGFDLVPTTILEEKMAGKGRKAAQQIEGEEGESGSELRMLMKMMLENNDRVEARRREDRLAEEERMEARMLAEAKRVDAREAAREEAARQAADRLREQQEIANNKIWEQHVELAKIQTKIGEEAAETHRAEMAVSRKRERAVSAVSFLKEGEDVEDFLATSERKLKAGGVREGEWLTIMASKMSGRIGSTWQDLCAVYDDYVEVKGGLLKICGYTPKLAGELFYGFRAESLKGMMVISFIIGGCS